jgi:hypothetical protein
MGRVGSRTVVDSLHTWSQETGVKLEIHHVHLLSNIDKVADYVQRERKAPEATLAHLRKDKELRDVIESDKKSRWNIISLVRDPVSRNISTFFYNLPEILPNWPEELKNGNLSMERLWSLFAGTESIQNAPIDWFDSQLKALTGIDVFASPFARERGYQIYPRDSRFNVMVVRLEDLNWCAGSALQDFLGIKGFRLKSTNRALEKDYSEVYKAFISQQIPASYLDRTYSTKLARHFYSPREIAAFKRKWSGGDESQEVFSQLTRNFL